MAAYQGLTPAQAKSYHEARTKQGFVEPLFRCLGWNFDDTEEVSPEEKASRGRVDYAFKLRGVAHFYLEAKPLKADLSNPEYAQQAITYAYNKGVSWAVLTDFEGSRVFNAQTGQPFLNLTCQDYLADFDRLWLLSKESLEAGALNREAAKVGALPPPLPVEKRLFALLRQWREELFSQLHLHNPHLTLPQVDQAILRLFNRLVFIRNCEDQGIEERGLLAVLNRWKASGRKGELIEELRQIFRQFDGYYDSDLFMLHPLDQVFIEAPTLERIINGLYEVPGGLAWYDFSVIDADVLGAVYEQYLGYVTSIAKQRAQEAQARLNLGLPAQVISLGAKRQKRKEQGIYYTPKWVVDYIVKQTVGRFLRDHSHDEILNIKVLDPACGSGSFLIRAYSELLNYHAAIQGKAIAELDQWDRLPILTRNIFGVDLDGQAEEIARLSLLLRSLAKREVLPSLAGNIRQGNSLISGGEKELKPYFGDAWAEKRPFNWAEEFPEIMKGGGFDVVIGNPPYVQSRNIVDDAERHYYWSSYATDTNHSDVFSFFVQKGIALLKDRGFLGLILPATWLQLPSFSSMRRILLDSCEIKNVATFESVKVFEDSEIEPLILIAQKVLEPALTNQVVYEKFLEGNGIQPKTAGEIPQVIWKQIGTINLVVDTSKNAIMNKLSSVPRQLPQLVHIVGGLRTGADAVYIRSKKVEDEDKPLLRGRNIYRYGYEWEGEYVWYRPDLMKSKQSAAPKEARFFETKEKLLLRMIAGGQLVAAYDAEQFYLLQDNMLLLKDSKHSLKYILAVLNSRLMQFFLSNVVSNIAVTQSVLKRLPIRLVDFNNPTEKKLHNDLVSLAEKMLELHQALAGVPPFEAEKRGEVEREVQRTDRAIDSLVYDLYGLTEEERRVVEAQAFR